MQQTRPMRAARRRHADVAAGFPRNIDPMLAAPAAALPAEEDEWAFEYKWDGVRALCYWDGRHITLQSRNRLDITSHYPELQLLGPALNESAGHRTAVLDGEIIALADAGNPSFAQLQSRMHVSSPSDRLIKAVPVWYFLFDLLYLDGTDLTAEPWERRRAALEELALAGPNWQTSPANVGRGAEMLEVTRRKGLEGVVAKRLDSPYQPGKRSGAWRKIKVIFGQEFVIGGWVPQAGDPGRVGSLLLGYYQADDTGRRKLRYAGGVGTGFSDSTHAALVDQLGKLKVSASPFADPIPGSKAHFVSPRLVAEIEYRRWPDAGRVQQAAFKGLRTDKPARDVIRERAPNGVARERPGANTN